MVIFFESGRLGNQLFQYVALRSFFPRPEKIVLVGFDSLKNTFDGVDAVFINKSNWLIAFLMRVVRKLERMGWLDHIFNVGFESESESKIIIRKRVSWLNIIYFKESYFQSEQFLDFKVVNRLCLKSYIMQELSRDNRFNVDLFFVHIRRGDYLHWPTLENPAALSDSWYLEQINQISRDKKGAKFLFFTDDPTYVRNHILNKVPNGDIFHHSEAFDLAAMTLCAGGVLSPSSYAWWAARLSCQLGVNKDYIAPNFWIGHSRAEWHPPGIKSTFLKYV